MDFTALKAEIDRSRALKARAATTLRDMFARQTELVQTLSQRDARIVELEARVAELEAGQTVVDESTSALATASGDLETALTETNPPGPSPTDVRPLPDSNPVTRRKA